MSRKNLIIGLFGFGVVGEGIYQVLNNAPTIKTTIKKIAIKHPEKVRNAPSNLFTAESEELLQDPEINLIVELIDNAEEAYTIVKTALSNGKHVVSANKKMIAEHLEELIAISRENEVSFLYEAAVCGSIPIIRNLEEYYDNDFLSSITGIINGSTNYILSKMISENVSFEDALSAAQELGFAESDPSLDISGQDAANKLSILTKHAFGFHVPAEQIVVSGITSIHESDITFAKEKGLSVKLVAHAFVSEPGELTAFVIPTFVSSDHRLATVHDEFNGILIGTKLSDEQFLYGKGAGRFPTASAVLSDISALQYAYTYEYRKSALNLEIVSTQESQLSIFLSYDAKEEINNELFETVEQVFVTKSRCFKIANITLQNLKKSGWIEHEKISVLSFLGSNQFFPLKSFRSECELVL